MDTSFVLLGTWQSWSSIWRVFFSCICALYPVFLLFGSIFNLPSFHYLFLSFYIFVSIFSFTLSSFFQLNFTFPLHVFVSSFQFISSFPHFNFPVRRSFVFFFLSFLSVFTYLRASIFDIFFCSGFVIYPFFISTFSLKLSSLLRLFLLFMFFLFKLFFFF